MKIDQGIHLINKPRGRSSFSMVAQVRRISGIKKVGHAGTLDPQAEGLLIVLVGKEYTKKSDAFLKLDKTYEFEMKLGETSTTGDSEGEITKVSTQKPTKKAVMAAIEQFCGEISQIPPTYSAIKIDGQRAYKMARKGQEFELKPRKVHVYELKLLSYAYPYIRLEASVSSGTYIRTLAEDIGKYLKTGAYASQIVRTKIDKYHLEDALQLD